MACPQILTGSEFVTRLLTHIDCQSRYLGSYGYEALAQPGSLASTVITGLLTLFIAIWGFRLMFGAMPTGRDLMGDVLKVGIVLTLAFSWPAFRTVIHDVTLDGPVQIAASLSNPALAAGGAGFVERLQAVDNAMLSLIDIGTGRFSGQFIEGEATATSFAGTALQDEAAFGWARLVYLAGLLGSLGLLRIVAGLLLALAPLAAGMLLFDATRGLFSGWLRGLVLSLLGLVGVTVILAVELAVLEPFLRDVLYVRESGYAAPSAPIELFALMLGFTIVQFLTIWLLAKIAFTRGWPEAIRIPALRDGFAWETAYAGHRMGEPAPGASRADRIAQQVENRISYEQNRYVRLPGGAQSDAPATSSAGRDNSAYQAERLGNSYRRNLHSPSLSSRRRDG